LAVGAQFAEVALVDFAEHVFNDVLQSVRENGSAQDVQLVAQRVGHFNEVAGRGRLEVLVVFFGHQSVP